MTGAAVLLEFDQPAELLNLNDRRNVAARAASVAPWRDVAYWNWCQAHPGKGPADRSFPHPAEVMVVLPVHGQRRRDPINFAPTVKAIVDGIALAGAWPDDTPEFVAQHLPTFRPLDSPDARRTVYVRVLQRPNDRKDP